MFQVSRVMTRVVVQVDRVVTCPQVGLVHHNSHKRERSVKFQHKEANKDLRIRATDNFGAFGYLNPTKM